MNSLSKVNPAQCVRACVSELCPWGVAIANEFQMAISYTYNTYSISLDTN